MASWFSSGAWSVKHFQNSTFFLSFNQKLTGTPCNNFSKKNLDTLGRHISNWSPHKRLTIGYYTFLFNMLLPDLLSQYSAKLWASRMLSNISTFYILDENCNNSRVLNWQFALHSSYFLSHNNAGGGYWYWLWIIHYLERDNNRYHTNVYK